MEERVVYGLYGLDGPYGPLVQCCDNGQPNARVGCEGPWEGGMDPSGGDLQVLKS